MEFMIHYFWLVHLTILGLAMWTAFKAIITHKFKHKAWNIVALIFGVILIFTPIKLKPTTDAVNLQQNTRIEQQKVLQPKVIDTSFDKATQVPHIQAEDLK